MKAAARLSPPLLSMLLEGIDVARARTFLRRDAERARVPGCGETSGLFCDSNHSVRVGGEPAA